MKKIFLSTLALLSLCNFIFSQAPQLINYQAIAHDNNGDPLTNKNITVRIGIISDAINGPLEWEEDHALTTNDYGLFSLKIGNGTSTNSGNQNSFANISWKNQIHFLNVQVDEGLGFEDLGTQQLVSVPYALFAKEAESVSNPTTSNLIDNQNGTFTYFNEIGLMTTFNANIDDADANPANELISSASLNNTSIEIIEGTVTHSIDLNPLLGNGIDNDWFDTTINNKDIIFNITENVIGTFTPAAKLEVEANNTERASQFVQDYASSSNKIGVYALSQGGGSGENRAVQGEAFFANTNKAIIGKASGGTNNWAGFFEVGDVHINDHLAIGSANNPDAKLDIVSSGFELLDLKTTGANSNVNIDIETTGSGAAQFSISGGTGGYTFLTAGNGIVPVLKIGDNGN